MEIKKKYFRKYLHEIALLQLEEDYKAKGFEVSREVRFGEYRADLVAVKGNEKLVIEIKTKQLTDEEKVRLASIADAVRATGEYRLIVVIATSPREKRIEVIDVEQAFYTYLVGEFPHELESLGNRVILDEISDIEVSEVYIDGGGIKIVGTGVISVELEYGGGASSDDGLSMSDSYPFSFDALTVFGSDGELTIKDVLHLTVDTDSFYE